MFDTLEVSACFEACGLKLLFFLAVTKSSNIFNIKNNSLTTFLEISKTTILFYTLILNNSFLNEKLSVIKPFELCGIKTVIDPLARIFLLDWLN